MIFCRFLIFCIVYQFVINLYWILMLVYYFSIYINVVYVCTLFDVCICTMFDVCVCTVFDVCSYIIFHLYVIIFIYDLFRKNINIFEIFKNIKISKNWKRIIYIFRKKYSKCSKVSTPKIFSKIKKYQHFLCFLFFLMSTTKYNFHKKSQTFQNI